jgi:hypothetical protein
MIALGAHVRVAGGRHLAGLAVVRDDAVVDHFSAAAPTGDEATSLSELYSRAHDMIGHHEPDLVVLLASEARDRADLTVARRAEGAILAAAGLQARPLRVFKTGSALRRPASLAGRGTNKETIPAIAERLTGLVSPGDEIAYAAAAAFAGLQSVT